MKILLFGKNGLVGWELQRSLTPLGELITPGRREADLEDPATIQSCLAHYKPDVIVNAAAYTSVDLAEEEPDRAYLVNAEAVGLMAKEAKRQNAWMVHYSTDYVFDGLKKTPYREDDHTRPLSVYGRSKRAGEELTTANTPRHLIFRTSWVYAARGQNFLTTILKLAQEKEHLNIIADQYGAPTSAELVADITALALYKLARNPGDNEKLAGIYHLTATGETSWYEYAHYLLSLARDRGVTLKADPDRIKPVNTASYLRPATRPLNSRLSVSKLSKAFNLNLPDWHFHVRRAMAETANVSIC